jgi:hypothetical protein
MVLPLVSLATRWLVLPGFVICIVASPAVAAPAQAEEKDPRPAAAIQDNACIVEEAYNQEPGVVQHILCGRRQGRDWSLQFTQEWPVGTQDHQLSYSVPYLWLRSEGQRARGIGDVMLNYRYQAVYESATTPAVAPRLSLILPSGSAGKGTGSGSAGYQLLLPVSKIISDRITLHGNAGLTSYFDIQGRRPTSYLLGASAVYAVTADFNLMLESLREWNASVDPAGRIETERSYTLAPGFRYAFNLDAGQLVVGSSLPIRFVERAKTDYGVLLYLSFEHKLR